MGQSASRLKPFKDVSKGIVITLDALGTIYKFRKPVGELYVDVARQCGMTSTLNPDDITRAFKSSYKSLVSEFPNYGKGRLDSPQIWWDRLATETFSQVVEKKDIPSNLGSNLYEYFSSNKAYELFQDVQPFLQSIRKLRSELSDTNGPAIIVGVITNSDPRVRNVFESLGLMVGDVQHTTLIHKATSIPEDIRSGRFKPPWQGAYDIKRDFDFLTTSYDCGREKPNPGIFLDARRQASTVMIGRSSIDEDYSTGALGLKSLVNTAKLVGNSVDLVSQMQFIHIGDELVKDYDGAKNADFEALLVDREDMYNNVEGRVSNLEEAAAVIGLIAQEGFQRSG